MKKSKGQLLREYFQREQTQLLPFGVLPIHALMAEMGQAISIVQFTLPGTAECWKLLLEVKRTGEMAPVEEYLPKELHRGYVNTFN